jgi:hypothetical protein
MKIKPVAKVIPSPIPTAAEAAADPSLLKAAPRRAPRGAGALLGAGLLGSLLAPGCTGRDASAPAATPPSAPAVSDPADAEAAARAEEARKAAATIVAPILQKALDEEGRGAFGCDAVDPPAFLSESDALDLIEQEFAKVGVKLRREFEMDGFTRTIPDKGGKPVFDRNRWAPQYPAKTVPGGWMFDLATEDGAVAVEFLSREDGERESFDADFSSIDEYDLPELAQRLRGEFATRTDGAPVAIALFFDPFASNTVWNEKRGKLVPRPGSSFAALSGEERDSLDWEQRRELLRRDARELLREQVRFFLDWAQREGRLPAPIPEK